MIAVGLLEPDGQPVLLRGSSEKGLPHRANEGTADCTGQFLTAGSRR
jgi:hypothetical protein